MFVVVGFHSTIRAGKFDFEDKYPEDPIYEEMGPNARLWRAFLDESEVFDMDMVTESRDGLDLLLVFVRVFTVNPRMHYTHRLLRLVFSLLS